MRHLGATPPQESSTMRDLERRRKYQRDWAQRTEHGYNKCACGARKKIKASKCQKCRYNLQQPRAMSEAEIAWLAGILEGEGCWSRHSQSTTRWWVAVRMTDKDIIDRLQAITGIGRVTKDPLPGRPGCKPCWAWRVDAKWHREWVTTQVWSWMGERRRSKIKELWPDMPQ